MKKIDFHSKFNDRRPTGYNRFVKLEISVYNLVVVYIDEIKKGKN